MAAYMIANVEINDAEKIKEYLKETPEVVKNTDMIFVDGTSKEMSDMLNL